eukprot:1153805-Pelagomonas_calceolata.AAC.6
MPTFLPSNFPHPEELRNVPQTKTGDAPNWCRWEFSRNPALSHTVGVKGSSFGPVTVGSLSGPSLPHKA